MAVVKIDLWNEFEEDGPEESPASSQPAKPTATDGSEWRGQYDRRKQPRDESVDEQRQDQVDDETNQPDGSAGDDASSDVAGEMIEHRKAA